MHDKSIRFLESKKNETAAMFQYNNFAIQRINKYNSFENLSNISNKNDCIKFLISLKPFRIDALYNLLDVIENFCIFSDRKDLYDIFSSLDSTEKKMIVNTAIKENDYSSIITYEEFTMLIDAIFQSGISNYLYYITLLRCHFEGVKSYKGAYNLRASHINGNILTVYESEKDVYDIEISDELKQNIIDLSHNFSWTRKNIHGEYDCEIKGEYPDSCFKYYCGIKGIPQPRASFEIKFKNLEELLGIKLNARMLYNSGIVYRIHKRLPDLTIGQIFGETKNVLVKNLIDEELARSGYRRNSQFFKKMIVK